MLATMKGTPARAACPVVTAAAALAESKVKAALAAKPTPAPTAATNVTWSRNAERAALKAEAATRAEHVKEYNSLQTPREREEYREANRSALGLPRRS